MDLLSKPYSGWTDFGLGEQKYSLSYLTKIPIDWLDQAIHGLETLSPFTVHGFCEPGRLLCLVSYWNCHIIYECDGDAALAPADTQHNTVHINMLTFCKLLFETVSSNLDEWCDWGTHCGSSEKQILKYRRIMRKNLQYRLKRLNVLIQKQEKHFSEHCFFC